MRRIKRRHRHRPTNNNRPPKQEDDDEEEEEHDQKPYILQLPVHIITEIFCKIPTKTLIQCKRVSKSWRCWFSDPQFTRELFSRTPASLWVTGHFLVDLDRIGSQSNVALQLFSNLRALCMTVVGSCNGFLCHYDFNSDFTRHLHISNPVTCEFFSLPIPSNRDSGDCYGFGFSPISDVYKLVRVSSLGGEPDQVMVLTVGFGIWRNIGHPGYSFYRVNPRHGIYLNGVLHWIGRSCRDRSRRLICVFDVESERFQELPLPLSSQNLRRTYFKLGILKGWLSVIHKVNDVISVWVMKDYGVKESWTKENEFKKPVGSFVTSTMKFTEQGKVLGLHHNQLMAYTLATTSLVRVQVDGLPSWISEAWELVPSFVSLKDIAGGLQHEGTICQS
ncbi:F-box/kelch-repeat protein At3g06240-like [Prunus dulcis]|uniref:F-box/kelch-repeat protein At3g06240-like n=1 Tax=Prunus dulcis TaxID=3755 RepID=UPI0014823708|nr:F-box/kelch-repeat protein At3g06240-like [Prunus dulcis]